MGYPSPPPPPGSPGGYGPPPGAPGYGSPPGSPPPGYGGPPPGYGGPPPGGSPPSGGSGASKGPLIALMSALVVVVLLAVVGGLFLATRGGPSDVELTESQLEDALLTEGDVGDDFTIDPDAADADEDDFELEDIEASEECLGLFADLDESGLLGGGEPDVEASVQLDGPENEELEHTLSQQDDAADLGLVREFVETCNEVDVDDGEAVGTIEFEILDDLVEVGDDSVTLSVAVDITEPVEISVTTVGVLWERRGTQASVNLSGPVDLETFESGDPDEGLLEDVVTRADERLEEVIDEA